MSEKPVTNPSIPYVGPLQSGLAPGKFVRILGVASAMGKGFSCNVQCGSSSFDDIALQLLVRLEEATIVLNSQQHGGWNDAQTISNSQISRGRQFEILFICEDTVFKIRINGQHLCDLAHKIPYHRATYIRIEGDVSISLISVENQPSAPSPDSQVGAMNSPPPYSAAIFHQPIPTQPSYPAPYPVTGEPPYPLSGPQQPPYPHTEVQQPMPLQMPVPLNNAPQTIVYPPGYASDPLLQQQAATAALNATPRAYQPAPFWQRTSRYAGGRIAIYVILGVFGSVSLILLVVFLVVYFTATDRF